MSALLLMPALLQAALPSTPLNDEFTTSTNETIPASWWWKLDIGAIGTWNIVGDLAQVNWGYDGGQSKILTGSGTINIGSETEAGSLYIMGSNPPSADNWVSIVSFNGTVNVGKMGSFTFGGSYISRWGKVSHIDTLNINGGIISVMADSGNTSYFCVKNLDIRDGGLMESALSLQSYSGGVWNLYTDGVKSSLLRVGNGNTTLNLYGQDVLRNLPRISFDENTGSVLRMNVSADNSFSTFEFNSNGVLELAIAEGASLKIKKLTTKNGTKSISNAEIVFYDYNADAFLLEDSTLTAEDDKLYVPSVDSYIKLTAYDESGNLLVGDWVYDWSDELGVGKLVLNAVPEPEAAAVLLGVLALAFVVRRRKK